MSEEKHTYDPVFWFNERGNILAYGRYKVTANDHLVAGNPFVFAMESVHTPPVTITKHIVYPGETWDCSEFKTGMTPYWCWMMQRVSEEFFISEDPNDFSGHMLEGLGMIDENGEALDYVDSYYNHPSNLEPHFLMLRQGVMNYTISEAELFPGVYESLNRFKHRGY